MCKSQSTISRFFLVLQALCLDPHLSFSNYEESETTITLSNQSIGIINSSIERLRELQELRLHDDNLTSLPSTIGGMKNVKELDIVGEQSPPAGEDENEKKSKQPLFPNSVGKFKKIEEIDFGTTPVTSLSNALGEFKKLQKLYFYNNTVVALPDALGELENLKELYIYNNKSILLPNTVGGLKNLRKLHFYNNDAPSLPDALGELKNLQELSIYKNKYLTSLPSTIGGLRSLQKLDLHENKLASLPITIGLLMNLHTLNLRKNQLLLLPVTMGTLVKLKYLDLRDNHLTLLPSTIGALAGSLVVLDLRGNNILPLGGGVLLGQAELTKLFDGGRVRF